MREKNKNKINFVYFAPFLKSPVQLAANGPRIAINCDYYLPLMTRNALVFWAMVLRYFSGTNARSQIIEGSPTKTEVTKALKAISVIFHSCRWYQKQIEIPSQVWQDLKTEQKTPITKKALPSGGWPRRKQKKKITPWRDFSVLKRETADGEKNKQIKNLVDLPSRADLTSDLPA